MGDPGLVAGDAVHLALAGRAGAQAGEVRAHVRLGEDRGRQHAARGDRLEPARLLRLGAIGEDHLAGDLGAGAERADPDIAPAELLGDHAHGGLAHAEPAPFLGHGEAEDAHRRQLVDHLHGDQPVLHVPAVGEGGDLLVDEAAELIAHQRIRLVEARIAEVAGIGAVGDELGEARPRRACVRAGTQALDRRGAELRQRRGVHAHVGGAYHLALVHGDAAGDLGEILGEGELEDERFGFAVAILGLQPLGPAEELAQSLHIGREPGIAVQRHLLRFGAGVVEPALDQDHVRDREARGQQKRLRRAERLAATRDQIGQQRALAARRRRGLGDAHATAAS